MPEIYVFSSSNVTNIWAGVGAKMWAVSEKQAANASIRTKSQNLPIGALGLLYCVETKMLTTPFVVTSLVDQAEVAQQIWPEAWRLPFGIAPLGNPRKAAEVSALSDFVPSLADRGKTWNNLFYVTPTMVFTPSKLTSADWGAVSSRLLD